MKSYFNIESHKNLDGSRTGYDAGGRSWRIRGRHGCWSAYANVTRQGSLNSLIGYTSLDEISDELSKTGAEELAV